MGITLINLFLFDWVLGPVFHDSERFTFWWNETERVLKPQLISYKSAGWGSKWVRSKGGKMHCDKLHDKRGRQGITAATRKRVPMHDENQTG